MQTHELLKICHNTGDLIAQLYLNFLLITQHEVPFINMSEATKKVERPTRERLMYKCHEL